MTRTLMLAAILVLGIAGDADAGRGRGHGGGRGGGPRGAPGGVVVRDHRAPAPARVRDHRRPRGNYVRASKGRYVFPGGVVRVYKRPVIRERYYNVRVRPPIIVEAYDPVPGYVWVAGNWTWGGAEWVWTPGYWAVVDEPVVSGGISVSAGITIR